MSCSAAPLGSPCGGAAGFPRLWEERQASEAGRSDAGGDSHSATGRTSRAESFAGNTQVCVRRARYSLHGIPREECQDWPARGLTLTNTPAVLADFPPRPYRVHGSPGEMV